MCGIIGYCGHRPAVPLVIEGLRRLEYRGYDSSGLAYLQAQKLEVIRAEGKLISLENKLAQRPNVLATLSIGHTRWATHGLPVEKNAHPHRSCNGALALVHNGIIENYQELKDFLMEKNFSFSSDTDTEVLANLIAYELDLLLIEQFDLPFAQSGEKYIYEASVQESVFLSLMEKAFSAALKKAHGAYAVVMLSPLMNKHILAARLAAPLLLGVGVGEYFVASDVPAFLPYTKDVVFLEDREIALLSAYSYAVKSLETGEIIEKTINHIPWDLQGAAKDGHKHFMLKEIMEQPRVIRDCLVGRVLDNTVYLPELDALPVPTRIRIVACGTSYNAGLWSQAYFESLAKIPVSIEIASEFRYRKPLLSSDELVLFISQSGETADTLGALRLCKELGHKTLGLCNVLGSSLAREADITLYTQAGPEISVASTKAMLSQMVLLLLIACAFGQRKFASHATVVTSGLKDGNDLEEKSESNVFSVLQKELLEELAHMPQLIEKTLPVLRERAKFLAKKYAFAKSFFFLGRGVAYALAIEGALKLKELSYIHAEGYASGEMKHGPIALIEPDFPSFVVLFDDEHFLKVRSGILEIQSRQGKVIALLQEGCAVESIDDIPSNKGSVNNTENENNVSTLAMRGETDTLNVSTKSGDAWYIPQTKLPEFLALPAMQLFSYEMADYLGKDVDQPRNLAKSVTVE